MPFETMHHGTKRAQKSKAPCFSLYQSTHHRYPEDRQDPIRFRNLVKELEILLRLGYPEVDTVITFFHQVSRNQYLTTEGIHTNPNSLSLT